MQLNDNKNLLILDALALSLDYKNWCHQNKSRIMDLLAKHGAILLRHLPMGSLADFNDFAGRLFPTLLTYENASTPRTRLLGQIYTSTEYPSNQEIPMHSENAYTLKWPRAILFFCVLPPATQGQTPIADNRLIFQQIPKAIRAKFIEKKLLYVRNYQQGVDIDWRKAFNTDDKNQVEAYCKDNSMDFEWKRGDVLCTRQLCQSVLNHPLTHEEVWFNQAHLFHLSSLPETTQKDLLAEFKKEDLPRNVYYGDGTDIEPDVLHCIRSVYQQNQILFDWQKGDILILDNILMCHGRKPFTGNRKIAVAMA